MKFFLSALYLLSLPAAVIVFILFSLPVIEDKTEKLPIFSIALSIFLLLFGIYGIIGNRIIRILKKQNPDSFEVATSYYAKSKGFFGKLFLFPFIHIKSRSSFIIALFGSLSWIVILLIVYFSLIAKL